MSLQLVLLDRDGVLNEVSPGNYVRNAQEFRWIPRSMDAVLRLQRAGLRVEVVTNQQGVALGVMTKEDMDAIHRRLTDELIAAGGAPLPVRACTHHESQGCGCRKPRPGLILEALTQGGLLPTEAILIGDSARDMLAAQAAGVRFMLVRTGVGAATEASLGNAGAELQVEDDLFEASAKLVGELR